MSLPATFSLIATSLPSARHATGIAIQSVIKQLPIFVGQLIGGLPIDRFGIVPGVRIALLISSALGLIVTSGALLGAALWKLGPAANFCTAATRGAVGTLFYVLNRKPGTALP